jgi:Flp pilus assembly protein CpaB
VAWARAAIRTVGPVSPGKDCGASVGVSWNRRSVRYLAAAAMCSVVGLLLLRESLASQAAASGGGPVVAQVVAARTITRGAVVQASDLTVSGVPAAFVQPGAFRSVREAVGRVALADLSVGEAATRTRLARVRAGPVASLIPQGLRAFAVPTSLPSGSVTAGDRVDVLATYANADPHTEAVVTGVQILMVLGGGADPGTAASPAGLGNDAAAAGAVDGPILLLLVSPDQEERLAYARAFADLAVAIQPATATPA